MTIVKKWEGYDVPEKSKHYHKFNFYKVVPCGIVCWVKVGNGDGWKRSSVYECEESLIRDGAIELPQEQFVPVVGEECEINLDLKWQEVYICGKTKEGTFVFEDNRGYVDSSVTGTTKFRPIKTEREKVIEGAINIMNDSIDDSQEGWAVALYEAGMLTISKQ